MPLKCSTHASVQKYKLFTVHLHDVRVHARGPAEFVCALFTCRGPREGCESYRGLISNYQCYEKAPIRFRGCRKEHLTDVLLAGSGLEMS